MQNLQDNGWEGICPNSDDCNVDNVNLKCGAARRRRDLYTTRRTRQINGASVLVNFHIVVKYENYGNNITVTRNHLERKATSLGSLMKEKVQSGSLDVEGAEVDQESFQTGQSTITCEPGRYPRFTTLSCASCPLGSVYDNDLKECTECPKGSYRDDDNVLICTPCRSGTSTAATGTLNATDCVPICEPGYYSLTGVYPCTPCSRFQYGPHKMATHCEECGPGSMASAFASTNGSDCSVFDAVISGGMLPHTVGTLQDGIGSFTLALWIRIPRRKNLSLNNDVSLHVKIGNGIRIQIGRNINATLNSKHLQTGIGLNFGSWQHVAVVSNVFSKNIKVFVQGVVQFTSPTSVNVTSSANDVQLSSVGMSETGLRMSGLLLTPTSLDDGDIESLASTCYHTREGAATMDGFKHVDSRSITLISPSACDAEDNCDPNPCHGHVCIEDVDGSICRCGGGFTGDLCQIPPDYCLNHECENGATCNNLLTNYTCLCATGFKGHLCENEIVDGGWSIWSNWSDCSKTCEGGNMARQRECNNPFPDPEGQPCIGEDMETAICNEDPCPACPPLRRSYGTVMDCNYTNDLNTCRAKCRDGLWFAPGYPPLPEYKCGAETAYEWNGRPPSCSEAYIPEKVGTISTVSYSSDDLCDKEKDMKTALLANAKDKIECVITETCEIDAFIEGCSDIFKRSLDEVTVKAVITFEIPLETEEIKKVNVSSSAGLSPTLMNFVHAISALGNSTNQLNTSSEILRIEVDGQEFDALSVETQGTVECPEGYIQLEAFCTDCPQGTYNRDSNECTSCPYGTYQDTVGSVSCEECPFGFSTPFLESTDISDCSVPAAVTTTKITVTVEGDSITGIVVGCIVGALFGCAVIAGIAVWQLRRRKRRRSCQIPDVKYHAYNNTTLD
ncbi:neurogenic locus notch homolog protein 1-like isoform X2 [Pecten maximus]|uniref:neurogenic locus notch homolog protein 1-like isoform X2 n=1 Tax=Pecten maximus TaxID=6579 RepID=UPI0014584FA6|nr:neurogenic locus notch homolog protein 1-like isoform X2 [Pecten maximus]